MKKEEIKQITTLIDKAYTHLNKGRAIETYKTLVDIKTILVNSKQKRAQTLGEDIDYLLTTDYQLNADGLHYIDIYGNIDDSELLTDLKYTIKDIVNHLSKILK